MACKVVQAYKAKTDNFEDQAGLPKQSKKDLESILLTNKSHDEQERFKHFCERVEDGEISDFNETVPTYIAKGYGSWKALATGIEDQVGDGDEKPQWSELFEQSDYRKFHDAVKEHRFVVTQEILPKAGIRLA